MTSFLCYLQAYVPRNKLAHMLSSLRAMDVAWLTGVFLSLLKKLKQVAFTHSVHYTVALPLVFELKLQIITTQTCSMHFL